MIGITIDFSGAPHHIPSGHDAAILPQTVEYGKHVGRCEASVQYGYQHALAHQSLSMQLHAIEHVYLIECLTIVGIVGELHCVFRIGRHFTLLPLASSRTLFAHRHMIHHKRQVEHLLKHQCVCYTNSDGIHPFGNAKQFGTCGKHLPHVFRIDRKVTFLDGNVLFFPTCNGAKR